MNDSQNLDHDEDLTKASELDHQYQNNSVVISKFSKAIEEVFDIGLREFIGDFGEKTRDYARVMIDSLEKRKDSNMQHTAQNKEPLFRRTTALKENDEHSLLQRHKDKPIKILGKYTKDIADERSSQQQPTKGKS